MPHVTVCICTFKRPEMLGCLLEALEHQQTGDAFTFSVVVADNDSGLSAMQVVDQFSRRSALRVTYCVEPRQNIALARNQALVHAVGEFIAFIDDDELPAPDWLAILFAAREQHQADGVLGPVLPHLAGNAPAWLRKADLYDFRKRYVTGQKLRWLECRTGNVLFGRNMLEEIPGPFRDEFATGGEDQDFFRRAMKKGRVFVWCDEAMVCETIQPSLWKRRVLLSRALLRGKDTFKHREDRWPSIGRALIAVPLYASVLPFLLLAGQHRFMKLAIKLTAHVGLLLAAIRINPMSQREG